MVDRRPDPAIVEPELARIAAAHDRLYVLYWGDTQRDPERVIEHAVKGMLPKNTLGRAMGKKLKVYTGAEHPHMAQQPREIKMEG